MLRSLLRREPVKFGKKLLGEKDVEALLQKLDRLTHEESLATSVLSLEVLHGLAKSVREVMESESCSLTSPSKCTYGFCLDEKTSADYIQQVLCVFGSLAILCAPDCSSSFAARNGRQRAQEDAFVVSSLSLLATLINNVFQVTGHEISLGDGSLPLIHRKTKTLHAKSPTMARPRGSSKGLPFWSGKRGDPCSGFTEDVQIILTSSYQDHH